MTLTPDQLRAVTTEGTDLAVLAGAGSGKTRVLVERSVHLVTERNLPLSAILAITFTEKAAKEMKSRLADALLAAKGPEARAEVEWAYVSTIHGFCARLLRENALEAGVDPAFDVLDEVQAGALLRQAFAEGGDAFLADRPEDVEALDRLAAGDLAAAAIALLRELRASAPGELRPPAADAEEFARALDRVIGLVDALIPLAEAAPEKSAEKAGRVLDHSLAIREVRSGPPGDALRALSDLRAAIDLRVSKALKPVLLELREEAVPAALRAAADHVAAPVVDALLGLLVEVDRAYEALKERAGALDFADLELRALRLLREHGDVRESIRRRFRQILVDEYQDVNPVQEAILAEIRQDGNHFAVGDVKQAIYGFRHADPGLFARYSEGVAVEGRVLLKENFRSRPALVAFANHCFSRLLAEQELVRYTEMVPAREQGSGEGSAVEITILEGESTAAAREAEAAAIARRIQDLVRAGEARYRDVAILFRALTDVKTYERALEDHGVPFYITKGGGFYQAREVVDLTCLLRTVENPRDPIALAATLRSPFAGLTEDGLLALVRSARQQAVEPADLLERPGAVEGLGPEDDARWRRFAALLCRLRTLAGRGTIREVATAALEESGYGTAVWLLRGGHRRAANLEKALQLADSFEGRFNLAEFLDALSEFRAREIRETEAPTGGEQEDVVRLLTVHGAKGLEFPVVFVPDLSRSGGGRTPALLLSKDRLGVRIRDGETGETYETSLFAAEKAARARREEEESLRVFYVAVTRAKERLFLSGWEGGRGGRSWWAALKQVLDLTGDRAEYGRDGEAAVVKRGQPVRAAGPRPVLLARRSREKIRNGKPLGIAGEEELRAADRLLKRVLSPPPPADRTPYQNTISELLTFAACPRCHYLYHHLGIPRDPLAPEAEERAGHDELRPTDFGIAVHEVLKAFDPRAGVPVLETTRSRLARLLPVVSSELVEEVAAMVAAFYESEIGREVLAADPGKVRREVPFLTRWETGEGLPDLLFRGQIDLLYPRPDGTLRVVDYKTGGSSPDRYRVQMVAYARAVRTFGGEDVFAALAYLRGDGTTEVVEVPLTEESLAAADAAAREFARAVSEGAWPAHHSRNCPYRTRPVSPTFTP